MNTPLLVTFIIIGIILIVGIIVAIIYFDKNLKKVYTKTLDRKPYNIFQGVNGDYSMRRTLAFILTFVAAAALILGIVNHLEWKSLIVIAGVPLAATIFLLSFTTWGDVKQVIEAVKGDKNNE